MTLICSMSIKEVDPSNMYHIVRSYIVVVVLMVSLDFRCPSRLVSLDFRCPSRLAFSRQGGNAQRLLKSH